jgi:hypothetical protein
MGYSGARGTLIYEKNLKAKISCQTPFKLPYTTLLHLTHPDPIVSARRMLGLNPGLLKLWNWRSDALTTRAISHPLNGSHPDKIWDF